MSEKGLLSIWPNTVARRLELKAEALQTHVCTTQWIICPLTHI